MPLSAGEKLGHYEIRALLGAGGMGEVYRAHDAQLEREVAIKVLPQALASDPERLARFDREAKILAALNHPNIAVIYGLVESGGQRAIVMELVEGETLTTILKRGAVSVKEAVNVARQTAEALEAAHEKGVVHRDLKPGNIMVTPAGLVKVLDFGLATIVQPAPAPAADPANSPTLTLGATAAGAILGTASYMSPEQAEGLTADKRSDIWSYGVVLWEMLTGQRLFEAPSVAGTLADVLRKEIDFAQLPAQTPPALKRLVRRCLERETRNRLRDIGEARVAIDSAAQPVESVAESSKPRALFAWIVASAVLAVALGGLALVHFRESPPVRQRIRFQIQPPAGVLLALKLSPDGRFLAMATTDTTVTVSIWLRPLDSLETRLLTSISGLTLNHLFWSADGEYVGLSAQGKLSKIARTGGPAIGICDLPDRGFAGAAWRSDGTILFAGIAALYRVPSSGGSPGKVYGEIGRAPIWLTGDRFLFSGPTGISTGVLDGANPARLLPDVSNTAYVPPVQSGSPGHLLFLRNHTLMAQTIDAEKVEVRGEAIPVAERVGGFGNPYTGVFSASANGTLAFGRGFSQEHELVWLDRSGKKLRTVSRPFHQGGNAVVRLSPDDSQAIIPVSGPNQEDLWIADLNRNTLSRFTFDGSGSGIWSPDGHQVLWEARDGNNYLKAADASGKDELLFKNPDCKGCFPYDWSSDGKQIAFTVQSNTTAFDIWLVQANGDRKPNPYLQSRFSETWAQISPNSRWMAYASDQAGQQEIFVESIPSGKGRWQISTEGGDFPVWRRDGKELFFRQGSKIMAAPVRLSETSIESGRPQALFEVPAGTRFQVSRDGQRFLIAVRVEGSAASPPLTVDTDWRAGIGK